MLITKVKPRVSETDGVGHINNTVIPVWFEAGREEIFKIFTPDSTFRNWKLTLVNMNIDYTNQIHYGKEVDVYTWVSRIGTKSFSLYEELFQEGKMCARGTVTYVNMDYTMGKTETIPSLIREKLQKYLKSEE